VSFQKALITWIVLGLAMTFLERLNQETSHNKQGCVPESFDFTEQWSDGLAPLTRLSTNASRLPMPLPDIWDSYVSTIPYWVFLSRAGHRLTNLLIPWRSMVLISSHNLH
jgi:hypothetical protein